MKIDCEIEAVEIEGETKKVGDASAFMRISRHWNSSRWVVLKIHGASLTFDSRELRKAIDACTVE